MHRRGLDEFGEERALKYVRKISVADVDQLRNEAEILCEMDHPHVARIFEYFENKDYFCFVMEQCSGGELFDFIIRHGEDGGHFTNREAAHLLYEMASALNYCHSQGIIHRDVKPENFLFHSAEADAPLKLIDFGISRRKGTAKRRNGMGGDIEGTFWYMAPEMFAGLVDPKGDVWGLGVIFFILLFGHPPFEQSSRGRSQIAEGKMQVEPEEWEACCESAKDLLGKKVPHP